MLTQIHLKELMDYNPSTGVFIWKTNLRGPVKAGDVVGSTHSRGYITTQISGKRYLLHRLAWLFEFGVFPKNQIDHIDNNRTNNRINNLREVTQSENNYNSKIRSNNSSGIKGVHWDDKNHKWFSQISANGKNKFLGRFTDINEAESVVKEAREKLHGKFTNHG